MRVQRLSITLQLDVHVAVGVTRNAPDGTLGWGLSTRLDQWLRLDRSSRSSHVCPMSDSATRAPELIGTAPIPGGHGELGLFRRGPDYLIKIMGGQDLMNTRTHGSEDALGEIACAGLSAHPAPRVLVGGLGMGFTLAAALRELGAEAEVVVAEIVPGVVNWNRGVLGPFADHPTRDPRVAVRAVDVSLVLREETVGFDAILLDVDNGPDGLTRASNEWLYSKLGLAAARSALRPGGLLAIWSAGPDRSFTRKLRAGRFEVEERTVRAHRGRGARHVIWLARKTRFD